MKIQLIIPVLFIAFSTQGALVDRLAYAGEKITEAKTDIKAGKFNVQRKCMGKCKIKCTVQSCRKI